MIDIARSRWVKLLPPNLQNEHTAAISAALDKFTQFISEYAKTVIIYCNIGEISEALCDLLALLFDIQIYDAAFPLDVKRGLIKKALHLSNVKGTLKAVTDGLNAIYGNVTVKNWYEYGGEAYYFRVSTSSVEAINAGNMQKFLERIYQIKNIRLWLEEIMIENKIKQPLYLGAIRHITVRRRHIQEVM